MNRKILAELLSWTLVSAGVVLLAAGWVIFLLAGSVTGSLLLLAAGLVTGDHGLRRLEAGMKGKR